MSKRPPPAPTASATGPCPTIIQIVGRPGTGSLPWNITPPDHPITSLIKHIKDIETFIYLTRIDDWSYLSTKKNVIACKSRKENPQKLTQLSSRSHPRHLVGKRTAQKDTITNITNITSDSQVNSNFPYRWSPASLTFNNYFYLFLYLYIT